MRLFYRRSPADELPVPGLAETAAASGWRPAPDPPFDSDLGHALYDIARDMHGVGGGTSPTLSSSSRVVAFRDAWCSSDAGRPVTVANARAIRGHDEALLMGGPLDVALCAVELPTVLQPSPVWSRRYRLRLHVPATPTGDPAFDERFQVAGLPSAGGSWLTPEVRRLILTHDDWVLLPFGPTLVCLTKGPYASADDVVRRIRDVLKVVAAVPTAVLPARTDHSVDDLAARIARIDSVEEAVVFLQGLGDADRERLARSDTPLADFADVRTPDEAMQRLQSMPPARQMQLMALFMH